jgi:hypothetical protein
MAHKCTCIRTYVNLYPTIPFPTPSILGARILLSSKSPSSFRRNLAGTSGAALTISVPKGTVASGIALYT